jgi:hypothetical protein
MVPAETYVISFRFDGGNWRTIISRHVKFGTEIDHKHVCTLYCIWIIVYTLNNYKHGVRVELGDSFRQTLHRHRL